MERKSRDYLFLAIEFDLSVEGVISLMLETAAFSFELTTDVMVK
jgi:hypothetical protein